MTQVYKFIDNYYGKEKREYYYEGNSEIATHEMKTTSRVHVQLTRRQISLETKRLTHIHTHVHAYTHAQYRYTAIEYSYTRQLTWHCPTQLLRRRPYTLTIQHTELSEKLAITRTTQRSFCIYPHAPHSRYP